MTMRRSPSNGCFYAVDDATAPADCVTISDADYATVKNLPPNYSFKFIGSTLTVIPPAPAPASDIWNRIKMERERRKNGGVLVGGNWFHTDSDSRIQVMGLVILGTNIAPGTNWKTMAKNPDGSPIFVPMTRDLANQIFQAIADLDKTAFAKAEEHRIAMEASPTPASYDFSAGWPAIFPG